MPAQSVSAAGDVNGDGIADLIVGAHRQQQRRRLCRRGLCGVRQTGRLRQPGRPRAIAAGTGGFKIQGEDACDQAGYSVSAAGDVNGDGIDDLIVGAVSDSSGGTMPARPMWCSAHRRLREPGRPRRHRRRHRRLQDPGRDAERLRRLLGVRGGRRQRRRHRRPDRRRPADRHRRHRCRRGLCGVRQDRRLRQPARPRHDRRRHGGFKIQGEAATTRPASRCRRRATSTATASTT